MKLRALAILFLAHPALAQEPPVVPAVTDVAAARTNAEGRRAIRGLPVEPLANESPELFAMRQFEEHAFPRTGEVVTGADGKTAEGLSESFLKSLKLPDLPVRWDAKVLRYLQFYKSDPKGRAIMSSWLKKQGRFRAMMLDALRRHDLPSDLIYISMIESGYEPGDLSRVGASGLWQFMDAGGKIYGLERSYWLDQRRSPDRATEAAMIYFHDLYVRFGNWHLALAGFNAGYGAVLHSMQKYNTNDYWELCKHESGLPWETCNYVPKAIATAIVGHNRAAFGYPEGGDDPAWAPGQAMVPGGTTLATAARACGVAEQQLALLNPELRRGRVPPGHDYLLRIPNGTEERFAKSFPRSHPDTEHYEVYVLKFGERLETVARRWRISVKELKRINGITDSTEVRGGTELLLPRERGKVSEADPNALDEDGALVALPDRVFDYPDRKRVFYRTRDGDSVQSIAEYFGLAESDLALWNHVDPTANLTSKMVLQLFVERSRDLSGVELLSEEQLHLVAMGSEDFFAACEAKRGRRRTTYVARKGDTLAKVGRRFGLTSGDLARINQFSYQSELAPGQEIVVYVPMTAQAKKEAQGRLRQAARLAAKFAPARKRGARLAAAHASHGKHR
jgi:membrane-bound lytic murein transglycosylase D